MKTIRQLAALLALLSFTIPANAVDPDFKNPPTADSPWVYWFWKNGNISREGITADLEAMERVGIGGVIMMEVALSVPPGKYTFFSDEWRGLFKHAAEEAHRLGISISINSAPGWTGSGGPWVTPEQSMQKVVFSEVAVSGPSATTLVLPRPEAFQDFYRDIGVIAFPTPKQEFRIEDIAEKALYKRGPFSSQPSVRESLPSPAEYPTPPPDAVTSLSAIVDITSHMNADGQLTWDVPEGNWTIVRIGHTSTGQSNRPAPLPGLECDKLDTDALDAHFRTYITALLDEIGPDARKAIVSVHLDSWEVGAQNWTRHFREEFKARRGYDLFPYLPVMNGHVVGSLEVSERFLWDLRQTVSEMIAEKHGDQLRKLAHEAGLWFSVEPYDMTPCDDMTLGATGDVPMCEFWSKGFDTRFSVREATSVAHVYDKPIVAAESFTSVDRWLFHPGNIKAQGDWAFCEGVNRLVIHRYIHQPYLNIRPGLSLGPHGLHYERTQTWWEFSRPWHEYIARCQHMLKQGKFVSDILYLSPEGAPNVFLEPYPAPTGYKFDACTPDALLTRVTAEGGQLVLPDGKRYQLLVLPSVARMTPAVVQKIGELALAGVTIVGSSPQKSPSLMSHPSSDKQIEQLVATLWNERVIKPLVTPTLIPSDDRRSIVAPAQWIWYPEVDSVGPPPPAKRFFRRTVSIPAGRLTDNARAILTADNAFTLYINGVEAQRGEDLTELYSVDIKPFLHEGDNIIAIATENRGGKPNAAGLVGVLTIQLDDGQCLSIPTDAQWLSAMEVNSNWLKSTGSDTWANARELGPFGMAPWEDAGRKAERIDPYPDSSQIESILADGGILPDFAADAPLEFVHRLADQRDVYFVANKSQDPIIANCLFRVATDQVALWHPESGNTRELHGASICPDGRTSLQLHFEALESYFVVFDPSHSEGAPTTIRAIAEADFPALTSMVTISGPWNVQFDPQSGGPQDPVEFEELADWSQNALDAIRYYSGTATYTKSFDLPAEAIQSKHRLYLDLGLVEVMASVTLNGKELGIAWKRPFRLPVGDAAKPGPNTLEIRVVNLWPNRMIGDENLPPDSDRNSSGTLNSWPEWLVPGGSSPSGRFSFATWRHWSKEDSLIPSGLIGPVEILREE